MKFNAKFNIKLIKKKILFLYLFIIFIFIITILIIIFIFNRYVFN
jgi:hypothetical protein